MPTSSKWSRITRLVIFFQAEDGIRDIGVTGVQTCALPIFRGFGEGAVALGAVLVDLAHRRVAQRGLELVEVDQVVVGPLGADDLREVAQGREIGRASCRERV